MVGLRRVTTWERLKVGINLSSMVDIIVTINLDKVPPIYESDIYLNQNVNQIVGFREVIRNKVVAL